MNRGYCRSCSKVTRAVKSGGTNHVVHAILTLITAGIWLLPWLIFAVTVTGRDVCNDCGMNLVPASQAPKK